MLNRAALARREVVMTNAPKSRTKPRALHPATHVEKSTLLIGPLSATVLLRLVLGKG
jgi:hypothetical protein